MVRDRFSQEEYDLSFALNPDEGRIKEAFFSNHHVL
jgi:hypothetical protein